MKKCLRTITSILCLFLSIEAFCQIDTNVFIKNFSTCTNFLNNEENRIQIMLGWSNRRCYYKEITIKEELLCGFKTLQLQEITEAMLEENYNPVDNLSTLKALQKYIHAKDTCIIKKR